MFALFAHPVSRVSSQNCFILQICLDPQGCLWLPPSCLGTSVLPGWVSFMEKGSFLDSWPLTYVPPGNTPDQHHELWCPSMVVWAESLPECSTGKVCTSGTHGQSSSNISIIKVTFHSAVKVSQSGAWEMLDTFTQSLREITQVLFDFWSQALGGCPIPADGDTEAGFRWKPDCRMQVAECPHPMDSTLGAKFAVMGVTSPFAERWLVYWAHGKCRLKTLQWQLGLIKVMFISQ